jgi:hypothetical protein
MRRSIPAALAAAALFPAAAMAQDNSCADEFAAIEKQIQGSALQAEYEGREAAHPLVLLMADGELVDLSGTIITATPYESWTGDRPVVDKVGGFLTEAKPLIESGDAEGCGALLEQARAEIASVQSEEEGAGEADDGGDAQPSAAPQDEPASPANGEPAEPDNGAAASEPASGQQPPADPAGSANQQPGNAGSAN